MKEHLELYAAVKGVPKHSLPLAVDDMVMSLGLKDKIETRAENLSGGMQRKLQVLNARILIVLIFLVHGSPVPLSNRCNGYIPYIECLHRPLWFPLNIFFVNNLSFLLGFTKDGCFVRAPNQITLDAGGHGYDWWLKSGVSG